MHSELESGRAWGRCVTGALDPYRDKTEQGPLVKHSILTARINSVPLHIFTKITVNYFVKIYNLQRWKE